MFTSLTNRRNGLAALLLLVCTGAVSADRLMGSGHVAATPAAQTQPSADGIWQVLGTRTAAGSALGDALMGPHTIVRFSKPDFDARTVLAGRDTDTQAAGTTITIPMPDGAFARFLVWDSPILAPELAAAHPEIRTFYAIGLDDPTATARVGWTSAGFHAIVLSADAGTVFIDPLHPGDAETHVVYFKQDLRRDGPAWQCETHGTHAGIPADIAHAFPVVSGTSLRTYRLALAATAEYTAKALATSTHAAGSKGAALARMTTSINRVNGIFQREVAVRLELSTGTTADPTALIFTDTATDGYTDNSASQLINQNQTKLDTVLGSAAYDLGHVFSTGGGGLAAVASVCSSTNKARAVTGSSSPTGDSFDVDFVAHEIGHQFAARHTFNAEGVGSCTSGTRSSAQAYEVGSGVTIMAYAGICGAQNLAGNSIDRFHAESLDEIRTFVSGTGATCGTASSTGNTVPAVEAGANYRIPRSTPFALTATGSDANGDALTYAWDQHDLGGATGTATVAAASTDDGVRPLFRSFAATASPVRVFPSMPYIIDNANVPPQTTTCSVGACLTGETLPTTDRDMRFQVTARDRARTDNRNGAVRTDSMTVTVTTTAGPFVVMAPGAATTWQAGTTQQVLWNVAGTTGAGINTANVRISLTTDRGLTWTVLLWSTTNDGSADITVPNIATTTGRIKVEAVGNIYFDVSDHNITITGRTVNVAMVVDDTGSMYEEIDSVRTSLTNTITRLQAAVTPTNPFPTVAILTFKDSVTIRTVSNVPSVLQGIVNSLSASGGADCPESANEALIAASNLLGPQGVAMLFTDADSRSDGPSRSAVISAFRPKNIRLSVLLSGTCSGLFRAGEPALAYADNRDGAAGSPRDGRDAASAAADTLGTENALRTFTELSVETGGLFTAIPEVNSTSDGRTRYANVATNLSVSTVTPAVALVAPAVAPRGSALTVEITGSNTNFQAGSAVSVSGAGITVGAVTVESPTRLRAAITVDAGAALGFRDVTVTTNLGAGEIESALGGGALQVAAASSTPQVLGVTPSIVAQGRPASVTVSGLNTAFTTASIVSFGSGVTVNSISGVTATSLTANVTVASTATIGYRNVTVTTGSQTASETVLGPLLVTAAPPAVARVTGVTPSSAKRGRTVALSVTGESTSFGPSTTVSLSGAGVTVDSVSVTSATSLVAIVSISRTAALGFRDITVNTGAESAGQLGAVNITDPAAFPSTLAFGATRNGTAGSYESVTPAQEVTVSYSGITAGTAWTLASDQPWVSLSRTSGNGAGRVGVSIHPNAGLIGSLTDLSATLTVTVPGAGITDTVAVRLLVQTSPASGAAPFGLIDTPVDGVTVSGSIPVTGWALDDVAIDRVEIWRDRITGDPAPPFLQAGHPAHGKVFIANGTFIEGSRPDVESAYPNAPFKHRAGWGYLLLTWGFPNSNGTFVLTALAWDKEGRSTVLGTKTIVVNNATATKPFGSIDVPAYGATFTGHHFTFGWALTPSAGCTMSGGQRYMTINSAPPEFPITYGANRTDIAAAFPGFSDSAGAGGAVALNSLNYTNGTHQIGWLVYDSCGNGEGIGSRFFTILNGGSSRAEARGAAAPDPSAPADLVSGTGPAFGRAALPDVPVSSDVLWLVRGMGTVETPLSSGATVRLSQTGRIEVHVTRPGIAPMDGLRYEGYLMVNGEPRALPLGSSFDARRGSFFWQPVAGFFGTYQVRIVQLRGDSPEVMWSVPIEVGPDSEKVLLQVDGAGSEGLVLSERSLRVEGWALDPQSTDGSGIGHVHVWAGSAFLGAATLGQHRQDVGDRYGRQFDTSGFVLTLPEGLEPGVHELVVYAWSVRTGQWEAARTVALRVR